MKFILFLGIFVLFSPIVFQGNEDSQLQKVYVDLSQISFGDHCIFANIDGEWISVDGIRVDAGGYYAIRKDPNLNRWVCVCKYNNNGWDTTCQRVYGNGEKCGLPRPWYN